MEPVSAPQQQSHTDHPPVAAPPVVSHTKSRFMQHHLHRATFGLTAEYSVFLIALGLVLSNLVALMYMFFGLITATALQGGASALAGSHLFALWLFISSIVALPTALVLWSRIKGELAAENTDGDLPKGAAKGFRTFWLVVTILTIIGLKMAAVYAPVAAAVSGGPVGDMLLSVTLPSLINAAILAAGAYMVTRRVPQHGKNSLLMWVLAALTVVLFVVDYAWASTIKPAATNSNTPSYNQEDYEDLYRDLYDDTYYDYSDPDSLFQ